MKPGTFSFRMNVPIKLAGGTKSVNIPIDAVVMPKTAKAGDFRFSSRPNPQAISPTPISAAKKKRRR